jgi:hypothetical protein
MLYMGRKYGAEENIWEKVVNGCIQFCNNDFHRLYSSSNKPAIMIIKYRRMYINLVGQMRNAYKIFVGKTEEKRPLGPGR